MTEAADEITRLNAENEELKGAVANCREHEAMANAKAAEFLGRAEKAEALVDEMREGLTFYRDEWQKAQHPFGMAGPASVPTHRLLCDYGERAAALITKASRDS